VRKSGATTEAPPRSPSKPSSPPQEAREACVYRWPHHAPRGSLDPSPRWWFTALVDGEAPRIRSVGRERAPVRDRRASTMGPAWIRTPLLKGTFYRAGYHRGLHRASNSECPPVLASQGALASLRNFASFSGDRLKSASSSRESGSRKYFCDSRNSFCHLGGDSVRKRLRSRFFAR
jgi:hypothetical protein